MASIARNNLVAAAQNIQGAQRYLSNVQFPYCTPAEVTTLNKATAYIFTDMQTTERHQHAMDCYSTTAKRCGALLQWINQVNKRIYCGVGNISDNQGCQQYYCKRFRGYQS